MKTVYIIIPTLDIGGSEKRFIKLWIYLQKTDLFNCILVIPKNLFYVIGEVDELSNHLVEYKNKIKFLAFEGGNYLKVRKILIEFCRKETNKNDILHFVLTYPIWMFLSCHRKTIYTYPGNFFSLLNFKDAFVVLNSFLFASKIDILDIKTYEKWRKIFFFKRRKFFNTTNSAINTNYFNTVSFNNKKNWLVLLGRFVDLKQPLKFVKAIPIIDKYLKENGVNDHKFFIIGYGPEEDKINNYIKSNKEFNSINYYLGYEKNPINILKYSKVYFSLQRHTNYPSNSLLEAISCGNIPIVTDVGSTRKIADPSFSLYVDQEADPVKLAELSLLVLKMEEKDFLVKIKNGRNFVKQKFSIENMGQYFINLYMNKR